MVQRGNLPAFDSFLERQRFLNGLDDFVIRLPALFSNRVTHAGTIELSGFREEPAQAKKPEEVDRCIFYLGYRAYFAGDGRSVVTRIEESSGEVSAEKRGELARLLADPLSLEINRRVVFDKFSSGELIGEDGLVISCCLSGESPVWGSIRPYWESYWSKIARPVVYWVRNVASCD